MVTASDGSADAGNPDGAASDAAKGSAGSDGGTPWEGLLKDADNLATVKAKGWKVGDDAVKSYRELETKLGSAITVPGDDAKPEDWGKVYDQLGRPKDGKYEFKRPENLPKELPYDENLAGWSKKVFHEAGLNPRQAQMIHDKFAVEQGARVTAHMAKITKDVEDTHAALTKEWGPDGSPEFKGKLEAANRAFKKLGIMEALQKSGLVMHDGALTDPQLGKAFAAIGEKMFADDKIDGDASGGGGPNPFKDPKNITEINRLAESDPERARHLAKEAGVNADKWLGRKKK